MTTPNLNMLPLKEYSLDGVIFRFTPYMTPATERDSKLAAVERPNERIVDTITRQAWFSIVEIEHEGEVFKRHHISRDPIESLIWAEENIPYRVFAEIAHQVDMGDYPLGRDSKMDENGVPEMTAWRFLATILPSSRESIGDSMTPSPEPDQEMSDS